jgi:hypothetical protein
MALDKDIENQFTSAVKSALDESDTAHPQSEAYSGSMPAARPRRHRAWGVALLCLAFAALAAVVAVAVLRLQRGKLERQAKEVAALPQDATFINQPEATAVAPPASPASGRTATAANSTAVVSPSAAGRAGTFAATPSASTAAAASVSPAAEGLAAPALAPTIAVNGSPISTASISAEPRQPAAALAARPHRSKVSRKKHRRATLSARPSSLASRKYTVTVSAPAVSAPAPTRSVVVSSTDRSVYWALEDSGTIFRWTDQKSWQQQKSGVQTDLFAGQAVSNTVCWAVGSNGTILLTTDGTRWKRIRSPTNENVVGISAANADVADIVTTDGSRFSTYDRGGNWQAN